jgi:hypothetical protein
MYVKEYTRRGGPWMSDIAESSVSEIAPLVRKDVYGNNVPGA